MLGGLPRSSLLFPSLPTLPFPSLLIFFPSRPLPSLSFTFPPLFSPTLHFPPLLFSSLPFPSFPFPPLPSSSHPSSPVYRQLQHPLLPHFTCTWNLYLSAPLAFPLLCSGPRPGLLLTVCPGTLLGPRVHPMCQLQPVPPGPGMRGGVPSPTGVCGAEERAAGGGSGLNRFA